MWKAVLNDKCKTERLSADIDLVTLPQGATWLKESTSPHLFVRKCHKDIFDKMMDWDQNGRYNGCAVIGNPGIGKLSAHNRVDSPFQAKAGLYPTFYIAWPKIRRRISSLSHWTKVASCLSEMDQFPFIPPALPENYSIS